MKKSNYTEEQIVFALKQAQQGSPISDVYRHGLTTQIVQKDEVVVLDKISV